MKKAKAERLTPEQVQEIGLRSDAILDKLWPVISEAMGGQDPEVQGAVLADLVARWIVGHICTSRSATAEFRNRLLAIHSEHIHSLIEYYDVLVDAEGTV